MSRVLITVTPVLHESGAIWSVVDDRLAVGRRLSRIIAGTGEFEVIGQARNVTAKPFRPDDVLKILRAL